MGGSSDTPTEKVTLESAAKRVLEEVYDAASFGGKIFETFRKSQEKIKSTVPFLTSSLIKTISGSHGKHITYDI